MPCPGRRRLVTPLRAPNANAHAEWFVRSINKACLNRLIPIGERHSAERWPSSSSTISRAKSSRGWARADRGQPALDVAGRVRRRSRLGGLLNYDTRAA